MLDEVTKVSQSLLVLLLELLHSDTDLTLVNDIIELLLQHLGKVMTVTLEIVDFLLLHLGDLLVNHVSVDLVVGVQVDQMRLHLFYLLRRNDNLTVGSSSLDEVQDLTGF